MVFFTINFLFTFDHKVYFGKEGMWFIGDPFKDLSIKATVSSLVTSLGVYFLGHLTIRSIVVGD